MPGYHSKEQKVELPTTQQIATLNSLLRETAVLAPQVNWPISSIFFSILMEIPRVFINEKNTVVLASYLEKRLSELDGIFYPGLSMTVLTATVLYGLYKLSYAGWQFTSFVATTVFPNGVLLEQMPHPAYAMQQKLGSKKEVEVLIKDLQKLIAQQIKHRDFGTYASFIIGLLVSAATHTHFSNTVKSIGKHLHDHSKFLLETPKSISLSVDWLGPHFRLNGWYPLTGLSRIIDNTASILQRLPMYSRVYNWWSNYDTPKQIAAYIKQLATLNYSDKPWQTLNADNKTSAMFLLECPNKNIKFKENDKDEKEQSISPQSYLRELHRLLLEAKFPIFAVEEETLFVGFRDGYEKFMVDLQKKLKQRLVVIARSERCIEENVKQLNQSLSIIGNRPLTGEWEGYQEVGAKGEMEFYYCFNLAGLPLVIRADYQRLIGEVLKPEQVLIDRDILTVKITGSVQQIGEFKQALKQCAQKINQEHKDQHPIALVSQQSSKKPKVSDGNKDDDKASELTEVKESKTPYPESIKFSQGFTFFREPCKRANVKRAYPLHVGRLPEGRGYASLDEEIPDLVSPHITEKDMRDQLDKGMVHSTAKADKSKVGTVGIKEDTEAYTNIYGECKTAVFAIKKGNIRILGSKAEVKEENGEHYIRYHFDGYRFGH